MFEPILESSRLPPTIPQALHDSGVDGTQVGSWGGCLAKSLLGNDVFPHGAMFEPVLESSRLPPTIPQALHDSGVDGTQVGSWGGCLAKYLLGDDVFPHGAMRWTG
jgi:hypothetical protein